MAPSMAPAATAKPMSRFTIERSARRLPSYARLLDCKREMAQILDDFDLAIIHTR